MRVNGGKGSHVYSSQIKAATKLGLPTEGHGWVKAIQDRMATIEHLHRRADGGPDKIENYALACRRCNRKRGGRKVEDHLAIMRERAHEHR
jgi:5-methylcytosine-specific restriction endonuclease McrA